LAFEYPPRSKFFRNELVQFLILAREEELDPTVPTGSYAGAMGRPQFMPSSFRAYAVDSTGDGKRDIWDNWADVAGSIANYFLAHRWRVNEEVVAQATLGGKWSGAVPNPENTLKVTDTIESLSKKGVLFATDLCADSKGQLLTYEGADGIEHWVGFHNFFVITKYNRSVMYALAVHQLGQRIASRVNADAS
jgi:membrane-bound lytic murein transglycosylase B